MAANQVEALEELLARTEAAHGAYEAAELNGVYDQQWPAWYARFAIDNGIGKLIGRDVELDELARFFAEGWDEMQGTNSTPTESWQAHMARRIASEL